MEICVLGQSQASRSKHLQIPDPLQSQCFGDLDHNKWLYLQSPTIGM